MARKSGKKSPLHGGIDISDAQYDRAIQSNSGSCLIADAIKAQYPHLSRVQVDIATVRFADADAGLSYTYVLPEKGQQALLGFDQGWDVRINHIDFGPPVKRVPIQRRPGAQQKGDDRLVELETKVAAGDALTQAEKATLTRLKNRKPRPARIGKAEIDRDGTIVAGEKAGRAPRADTPNLLRGHDRHFGAKTADPGQVLRNAVQAELEPVVAENDALRAEIERLRQEMAG